MKTLGTEQLLAMTFERLAVGDDWKGLLGRLPTVFMMIIYGGSGEGKTEVCVRLAKELTKFGKVEWVSYEQGHAADIQDAVVRNNMKGTSINWTDPWEKLPPNKTLFEDLFEKMAKPKSAKYWFIDSADATKFTEEQILQMRARFKKKKGIIFIAHAKGREPEKYVSRKIEYYGEVGILVKDFIAVAQKNRFGGFDPYIVWEEKARERNPLFFEKEALKGSKKHGRSPKKTKVKKDA